MAKNKDQITVYPAYAGVILMKKLYYALYFCLSRIRGGDPVSINDIESQTQFIPHTRG